jgi:four helix bundle protein
VKQRTKDDEAAWRGFEDLQAWQLARELMIECHRLADALPAKERYDLASQIRRSSKSVMSNIAEGYGRYHYLDSLRFYYIARGSLDETINHVIIAHDLTYIDDARAMALQGLGRRTERTLNGYINYVRKLKAGSATYGDKYIPTPDARPGVAEGK